MSSHFSDGHQLCGSVKIGSMAYQPLNYAVTVERALEYAGGDGAAQLMDLYIPETGSRAVPVVIWLHGGGWFTGDRTLAPDLSATAARTGLAFASIEYRLSGEATFPAPLDDVIAAIRHLRAHGRPMGLDGEHIGLWGASAGAHLAVLASLTASSGTDGSPYDARVSCVAACYPPVDLELIISQRPPAKTWDQTLEGQLLGQDPGTKAGRRLALDASPLTFVSSEAPPFLLCHGTNDVLVPDEHSRMLFEQLQAKGAQAQLYLLDGYRHGFVNPPGRLDVELAAVMDDGRLETEVTAASVFRETGNPESRHASFGFADIEVFLTTHLSASIALSATTPGDTTS